MPRKHLMSTAPLLCHCRQCHRVIWFAYDEGMPVYADIAEREVHAELQDKLRGRMTFNLIPGVGLWLRDEYGVRRTGIVVSGHEHRAGFYEMEPRCPIQPNAKVTDLSVPLF